MLGWPVQVRWCAVLHELDADELELSRHQLDEINVGASPLRNNERQSRPLQQSGADQQTITRPEEV